MSTSTSEKVVLSKNDLSHVEAVRANVMEFMLGKPAEFFSKMYLCYDCQPFSENVVKYLMDIFME